MLLSIKSVICIVYCGNLNQTKQYLASTPPPSIDSPRGDWLLGAGEHSLSITWWILYTFQSQEIAGASRHGRSGLLKFKPQAILFLGWPWKGMGSDYQKPFCSCLVTPLLVIYVLQRFWLKAHLYAYKCSTFQASIYSQIYWLWSTVFNSPVKAYIQHVWSIWGPSFSAFPENNHHSLLPGRKR